MIIVLLFVINVVNDINNCFGKVNILWNFLVFYVVYMLCVCVLVKFYRICVMVKVFIWCLFDVCFNFVVYFENVLKSL